MNNLDLAYKWYKAGTPVIQEGPDTIDLVPRINHEILGDLWRGIEIERDEHNQQASAYASEKTGYTFDPMNLLSDDAMAYMTFFEIEYNRLEANAVERRVLALAASITD